MPAKTPNNCKTKRIKAHQHPFLLLKDSKTKIHGALLPCKKEITKSDLWLITAHHTLKKY